MDLPERGSLFSPPPLRSMAGRGRGWGAAFAHSGSYYLHHALDIAQHVIVPKPQHAIAARLKIGSSSCIRGDAARFVVLSAIEFDHQARGMTSEVRKVSTEGCLSPKMRAID